MRMSSLSVALALFVLVACSSGKTFLTDEHDSGTLSIADAATDNEASTVGIGSADLSDTPIEGLSDEEIRVFNLGDALFGVPLREADGLGPLYTRSSCVACHEEGVRGPGLVQKFSLVLEDRITPSPDQSSLLFGHTVHPLVSAGATTPILPPTGTNVHVSVRVGPPVLGRGYMEAVDDAEIERVEKEQALRTDSIHGRINHVLYASDPNPDERFHVHKKGDGVIGRFGMKARIATLDDFVADALLNDMGITNPLRPAEFPNPDGLTDDAKPGLDTTFDGVNVRAMYMRLLAIPRRSVANGGAGIFASVACSACHVPSLRTRVTYPIPALAGIDAAIYSDLLLHDMGTLLADGSADGIDGQARSRDWKTAPLIGLRFNKSFLHDGRAKTVEEAILAHEGPGSEATESIALFRGLSTNDKKTLLEFVGGL